jgi:hypothetical protein
MKSFAELTEQEILALAIANEEEDSRIYRGFAEGLRENYAAPSADQKPAIRQDRANQDNPGQVKFGPLA